MRRAGVFLAIAPLLAAMTLSACGGDKPPSGASEGSTGAPPAAPVEPTEQPLASLLLEITPLAPPRPATPQDALLGGTPNRRAAALVRDQLKAAGLYLPGLEVYVLPVTGTHEEILVVEIDSKAMQASGAGGAAPASDDSALFFKALAAVENTEIANVTRVVFNVHGEEAGTRSVVTLVLPMSAVSDAALGIQGSGSDLLEQLQFEIRAETGP